MSLLIIKPGVQSTIQARSRNGMRHLGIPSGGAADPLSLALAKTSSVSPTPPQRKRASWVT